MNKPYRGFLIVVLSCCWWSGAGAAESYRYHRAITAAPGWIRLVLPKDVLDKSKPGLGDVRILSGSDEIPYALEEALVPTEAKLEFENVESTPNRETTALLDRGTHAALCSALEVFVSDEPPYLKPLILESSRDRVTFARIAQGSVFATAEIRNTVVSFAPNDARYLRVRFDDRLSAPVRPASAIIHQRRREPNTEELSVKFTALPANGMAMDTYALELPASNLMLASIGVGSGAAAFSRKVRIYETIVFRGELSRRLVREGVIRRSPGGQDSVQIPIEQVVSRRLEIEIEHATVALTVSAFTVYLRPRALVFFAGANNLELEYGSAAAHAPQYDIGKVLGSVSSLGVSPASLGPIRTDESATGTPPLPRRGQIVDVKAWQRRQSIRLPSEGGFAYLDLPRGASERLASVRIVDSTGAQVPYVVETEGRHTTTEATYQVTPQPGQTQIQITHLSPEAPIDGIGLNAASPEFFERSIQVTEAVTDARGDLGPRSLGNAVWKRVPGEENAPFVLNVDRPGKTEISVIIDDGDNAPLELTSVFVQSPQRRIDFAFKPTDQLSLIWDNPVASPPRYDAALMADTIIASPASPALLGPLGDIHEPVEHTPKWFWWVASLAGLIVTALLARTLIPREKRETQD